MILYKAIIATVADAFGVSVKALMGRDRHEPLVFYRQIAMYLCRKLCRATLREVGRWFSRNTDTIRHACRRIDNLSLDQMAPINRLERRLAPDPMAFRDALKRSVLVMNGKTETLEAKVLQICGSGDYVKLRIKQVDDWHPIERYTILEVLHRKKR